MAIIQNDWKVTTKLVDWELIATLNPHKLTIEQLVELLKDEKCSWIEWVIVNWCEINFKRLDWFN